MLIDCPGCAKSYHIIRAALGPTGRRVACPRCDTIWFVATGGETGRLATQDLAPMPGGFEISTQDVGFEAFRGAPSTAAPAPVRVSRRIPSFIKNLAASAALLGLAMALIGFRAEIVRLWPPASNAYAALGMPVNLFGLELRNLHTVTTRNGTEAVLGIEGEIVNIRQDETRVPPVDLAIRDQDGHVLYSWTVASQKRVLAAGESFQFRARLAEPPAGGREVLARFASEAPETLAAR